MRRRALIIRSVDLSDTGRLSCLLAGEAGSRAWYNYSIDVVAGK